MRGMNKVMLIGHVGNDPEMIQKDDLSIAKFRMATTERWKDRDGYNHEKTEWHNIVAFRRLAEIIGEYVSKGTALYVEGRIQTNEWNDDDGNPRSRTEIIANNMILLGSKATAK